MNDPSFHGRGIFAQFTRYDWGMLAFVAALGSILVVMEITRIVSNSAAPTTAGEHAREIHVGSTE